MFRLPIVKFFNRIFNRVTITAVLVALQVLWLLWAFWSFTAGRVWLNGALKALSILIVLYLVRKDENSAYKIGWIVLIGLLPLLGGALYLAFGNKAPAKHLRERMQKVEQAHQTELAQPEGQTDALDISSRNLSRYVAKFGPYPAWRDTAAHYFSCGRRCIPSCWQIWKRRKSSSFWNSLSSVPAKCGTVWSRSSAARPPRAWMCG